VKTAKNLLEMIGKKERVVFRGTGKSGLKKLRPSSGGVFGQGIYFYATPYSAKVCAERGGGVIVGRVDKSKTTYHDASDPVVVVKSGKDVEVLGVVPTDKTGDEYMDEINKILKQNGITELPKYRKFTGRIF